MVNNNFKLGELTGDVKGIKDSVGKIEVFMKEYDSRITDLENWRSQVLGIVVGISSIVTFLITFLTIIVQKVIADWKSL